MLRTLPTVAVTIGDVAGIGPEVVVRSMMDAELRKVCLPLVIGHEAILNRYSSLLPDGPQFTSMPELPEDASQLSSLCQQALSNGKILCWNPAGDSVLDAAIRTTGAIAGEAAYCYLVDAIRLTRKGLCKAIATAPLNKESLHAAGHDFPGHTEILAAECGVTTFAMMLYLAESRLSPLRQLIESSNSAQKPRADSGRSLDQSRCGLSIAHVTLHTSISSVPQLLTTEGILQKTRLVHDFLVRIGCQRRAIAVCALNPHGGENGLFGDEETRLIRPAVALGQQQRINVFGPLPVDTLIRRAVQGEFDGVVAMYHDQGHIPVKLIGFDAAVNITLGLPIVRTSPTHGTAFDRAWDTSTPADPAGMIEAIRMAARLCQ